MKKRVFIIHGWGGKPDEHWLPWLGKELEKQGFTVVAPSMPNADKPVIEEWVPYLTREVGELDEHTYFVGHSIGCQTIIRYLETQAGKKAGGCVFVAGWFKLENLEEGEEGVAEPWERDDIDYAKVKSVTQNFTVLNSSDDDYGAVEENKQLFEQRLGAKVIIMENMGHFTEGDGVTKLPAALEAIMEYGKNK
ncbi:MAG: serine hydrolase family protein [Candidatus Andersenbacteria bacterium]|nr:serine hydrolase family protein [Candidatus Andersenbacteria bacterium]